MTEGIIQRVFNKYYAHDKIPQCEECKYAHMEVKQKLIEEIKKTFDKEGMGYNIDYYNKASLLKLIGDSQE